MKNARRAKEDKEENIVRGNKRPSFSLGGN